MPIGTGELSEQIVDAVIDDLTDRKGLRHEWHNIDEEMQADIRETWMLSVRRLLEQHRF